jgi:hypothetical protein
MLHRSKTISGSVNIFAIRPMTSCLLLAHCILPHLAATIPKERTSTWTVTDLMGQAFLKARPDQANPLPLQSGSQLPTDGKILLIVAKESLLEITHSEGNFLRLGRATLAECSTSKIRLLQGSFLRNTKQETLFALSGKKVDAGIRLKGTLMAESTGNGGLKVVLVAGKADIGTDADGAKPLRPGQLIFVHSSPARLGDLYDLDLPLLLSTSRLVSGFKKPLPDLANIRTSMLIQGLNTKRRYEALVGDAPDDKKVQMWAIRKTPDSNSTLKK